MAGHIDNDGEEVHHGDVHVFCVDLDTRDNRCYV